MWLYFDPFFIESPGRVRNYVDDDTRTPMICVTGAGASKGFSALMTDMVPNFHFHDTGQCFPLRRYEAEAAVAGVLDFGRDEESRWRLNIGDYALKQYLSTYSEDKTGKLTKEDIFYYVYGILHSPEYKRRFASDLKKMLPRIPMAGNFWAFGKAGRKLADLHVNYEKAKPYPVTEHCDQLKLDPKSLYKVQKMYFGKSPKGSGKKVDKTTIIYNGHITITGIPLGAYEYVVNGKPAIEWLMERYQVTKDKDSGIENDPNDWATEHDDPEYILRLLKSIITVSLETMKIVKALPPLNEKPG